eukprot:symbB.v1.2.025947.t1/scaffold2554.1/size89898/9
MVLLGQEPDLNDIKKQEVEVVSKVSADLPGTILGDPDTLDLPERLESLDQTLFKDDSQPSALGDGSQLLSPTRATKHHPKTKAVSVRPADRARGNGCESIEVAMGLRAMFSETHHHRHRDLGACRRWISRFVRSQKFEYLVVAVIVTHTILVGAQINGMTLTGSADPAPGFRAMDIIICIFFALEVTLRLTAHGFKFFYMLGWGWNVLDFFLVLAQILEEVLILASNGHYGGMDFGVLRIVRTLRCVRLLRVLRITRFFDDLRRLVACIVYSAKSFIWSVAFVFLLVYIYGLYLTQSVHLHRLETGPKAAGDEVGRSILSLFQALTGGIDWRDLVEPLSEYMNWGALLVLGVTQGMEVASHTKDAILSAAAFADFQGEVAKQLHEGNQAGAEGLWLSAVEILHKPWFLAPTAKPSGLPQLRLAPCMAVPCTRCSEPDAAWQRLLTRPEKMDRMLVAAYSSGKVAEDVAPMAMATVLERATDRPGYASKMGVLQAWHGFQRGHPFWQDPGLWLPSREAALRDERSRCQRSLAGWLQEIQGAPGPLLAGCSGCGTPAHDACKGQGANDRWQDGFKRLKGHLDLCWQGVAGVGHQLTMLARVAWQFGAPHASMTGSSGFAAPWRPRRLAISMFGRRHQCQLLPALVISALMGASLGSKPYGEPCQCMERRSGPSSSSRREAHLPLQEDPARWSATTALELAARERVLKWRVEHGLEEDSDFAFRWSSHEEAIASSGHSVAHEWLRIRAEQSGALLPAPPRVMEELPRPTPSMAPSMIREPVSTKKKTMFGRKRPGVRLKANPSDAPEAVCQRVEALSAVMMRLGALMPSGSMSRSLHEEWRQACLRLSQRLVTQAEAITVVNALKTADELQGFMRGRDRGCVPERVDLDAYIHSSSTPAPGRALASLKWLSNNGRLGWELQDLSAPEGKRGRRSDGGPAIVVAPPMLAFTEETIERMQSSGNERWTALLGNWLIAVGCLRYRHVLRASPRRISMSTMHCFCWRGKQRANRQGFHFSVPTEFSSGWPWAQHWLDLYNQVPEKDRQHCGLCFDRRGRAWTLSEVTRVAQEIFSDSMADTSQLKSYSFRRWGPTFGKALALSPMELNALGDWQARGETPRDAIMPLHYSSARYSESMKMKHLLLLCSQHVCEYEAWEVIPPSVLREACDQGRKDLDRQVHRDIQNVWDRTAMSLKSARVCGGRHPACECHDKRFLHAGDNKAAERVPKPEEVPQAAAPASRKRPRRPSPPSHPDQQHGGGPLADNREDEEKFDRLATSKGRTAQRPTLVLRHASGGQLWLAGLPTVATLEAFPAVTLQIVCFSEPLERRGGIGCPGALCKVMAPTDKANREAMEGGRHRAAGITVLVRSLLQDCTLEESDSAISRLRDIEFSKFMSTQHAAEWIWWTFRHATVGPAMPPLEGYMATERSQLHIRTVDDMPLCHHKQSTEKAASRLKNPLQTSSLREAALRTLGKNFKLNEQVVQHLIKAQIENLDEFRFFWDSEEKVEGWINKVGIADETAKNIQLARLRRAWSAVRLWYQQAEQDRSKVATADLDTMLQDSELRDFKLAFWIRYRQRFPPELHPSDATLSRVCREMSKRTLCVFSVWKVRSLQYQLHTTNKKRKLAEGLFTEEAEEDDSQAQDWETYLDKLQTLMIAYSLAGVSATNGPPAAAEEAKLPDLTASEEARVRTDNSACSFVLDEIQALAIRGGASVRENPWRSLHWYIDQEQRMMQSGLWWDRRYSACCFMGARAKSQCLRHNVEEINQWPPLDCHHTHDPKEWDPVVVEGARFYPSKEEAEYTASLSFAIAVALSWWAARTGRATLHVPRMPSIQRQGRRDHWLSYDPRSMRQWAMAPMAISLGLTPQDPAEASRIPRRARVEEVITEEKALPPQHVYVGRGHHSHRLPTTLWKSPVMPGHDCPHEEWIAFYVQHICCHDELWEQLPALQGQVLVCDCPWQELCEADLLAGLVFEATRPSQQPVSRRSSSNPRTKAQAVVTAVASSRVVTVSSCPVPPQPFRQESIALAFRKLFPSTWFDSHRFPMLEDLINQPPFTCFLQWRFERQMEWDGPLNPALAAGTGRLAWRMAEGKQAGALSQRAALPPLLPFGLGPEDHFLQARHRARQPLPTENPLVLDSDLEFAGYCHAQWRGQLRHKRDKAIGALKELKSRMTATTSLLASHQTIAIRQVTAGRDLGLLTLLLLLASWGDTGYPYGLIKGLPAVGFAPHYQVFPHQPAEPLSMADVLDNWEEHNSHILRTLRAGKDDEFLLTQSIADSEQGFCTPPLRRSEFLAFIKNQPHRLIPRCVITQSSGKQRVIDNADTGGQSERSAESNKLVLCSPLRAAQHIGVALRQMTPAQLLLAREGDSWESGGEDWPNAYRHSPMSREESLGCVVTWFHSEWQEPAFQVYTGLLFGLPLAVTSFNRYSRLIEALARRFLYILVSMYFDDACLSDWSSSRGSGQLAFEKFNYMLGTPFADDKKQPMKATGQFLGPDHDVSQAVSHGYVSFWARERLEAKVLDIISTCRTNYSLLPGTAAKLYGILNFLEQGIYGRVGCGGLAAIKERQYERGTKLTEPIAMCFEVVEAVLQSRPKRLFQVLPSNPQRFCIASDAALEAPRQGTGGFVMVWFNLQEEHREAFVADIPDAIYDLWSPGDKKIAQLELLMVLYGLLARPDSFRHRRGIWFIDNTTALMALIRGRSDSSDLERMASMIHAALYSLECWIYWEWIPSKSNWSDAISRLGFQDPWLKKERFQVFTAYFPLILWQLPFRAIVRDRSSNLTPVGVVKKVMNIITGNFVSAAMERSQSVKDVDNVFQARRLFKSLDIDDNGAITIDEIRRHLESKPVQQFFRTIDVDSSEAEVLFEILDLSGDGSIDREEFISGCLRLQGAARAVDLLLMTKDTRRGFEQILCYLEELTQRFQETEESLLSRSGSGKRSNSDNGEMGSPDMIQHVLSTRNGGFQCQTPQEFLELVKETCDDYAEISEIVERHSTLETANIDLAEIQTESETQIEELRGEFQSYKKEQEMEMMELRNKVATLQIELDECQKKRSQLQHEFDEATQEDSKHSLKFGQILMSVENLFLRCTTKRKNIQHAQTPVDDEGKQEGEEGQDESEDSFRKKKENAMRQLKVILAYLKDLIGVASNPETFDLKISCAEIQDFREICEILRKERRADPTRAGRQGVLEAVTAPEPNIRFEAEVPRGGDRGSQNSGSQGNTKELRPSANVSTTQDF